MATGNPIARLFVRLGMDKAEFDRGTRDVQKQTKGMTDELKSATSASQLMEVGLKAAGALGAAKLAVEAAQAAWALGELGARSKALTGNLEAFAGGAEEAAGFLGAIDSASMGALDQMQAAEVATRMLQMGLADTTQEMELYVEGAIRLGNQSLDAAQRVEEMTQFLKNLNLNMADNFGLSRQVLTARTEELQATQGLTREQALLVSIQEEMTRQLQTLGERTDVEAQAIDEMNASLRDLRIELGEQFAPAIGEAARMVTYLLDAMGSDLEGELARAARGAFDAGMGFEYMASAALEAKARMTWGSDASFFGLVDMAPYMKLTGEQLIQVGEIAGASVADIMRLADALGVDLPQGFAQAGAAGVRFADLLNVKIDEQGQVFERTMSGAWEYSEALTQALRAVASAETDTDREARRLASGFGVMASAAEQTAGPVRNLAAAYDLLYENIENKARARITGEPVWSFPDAYEGEEGQAAALEAIDKQREENAEREKQRADQVAAAWESSYDRQQQAVDDLRSAVRSALTPTSVTALDMAQAGQGTYQEKWDESARQLDAIAARGFAELDAHPDWEGMLKIPPNVLAAGEQALRDWAGRTSEAVRALERPDLLVDNIDAAVQSVRDYLNRQAAQELSLDMITNAAIEQGVVGGDAAKSQVAEALGLSAAPMELPVKLVMAEEEEGGGTAMAGLAQQMMAGVESAMSQTPLVATFLTTLEQGIKANRARLIESGKTLWDTINEGIWQAMNKSDYVIKMARLIAPEVAKILIRDERYTTP